MQGSFFVCFGLAALMAGCGRGPGDSESNAAGRAAAVDTPGVSRADAAAAQPPAGCGDPASACFAIVYLASGANPFLGRYSDGRFIDEWPQWSGDMEAWSAQILAQAERWPRRQELPAVSTSGTRTTVVLDSIVPDGDPYDPLFEVRRDESGDDDDILLVWTPNVDVEWLEPVTVALDAGVDRMLRAEGLALYQAALRYRGAGSADLGDAVAQTVQGEDVVTVQIPVRIRLDGNRTDDRGSLFFIVDPASRAIVYGTFGHPEWSPDAEGLQTVKPLLYFRMRSDDATYILSDYAGPWEDISFAILEMRTGRAVLRSY